jgi:hypothetical protein
MIDHPAIRAYTAAVIQCREEFRRNPITTRCPVTGPCRRCGLMTNYLHGYCRGCQKGRE